MKHYPSIKNVSSEHQSLGLLHTFEKPDGSNLRFEWCKKNGWNKFGTRNRLFDKTDPVFGEAVEIFMDLFSKELETIFRDQKYEKAISFGEFYGDKSFAGEHDANDVKTIALFDVAPYKQGILGPEKFLELFGHLNITPYLGLYEWDSEFLLSVRNGEFKCQSFEGVIGKSGDRHNLFMAKAKTQKWIDAVRKKYGHNADRIINS